MAYVDSFEHDIFLSYARVDDRAVGGEERGWVGAFEEHLRRGVERWTGRIGEVKLWRDVRRMDGAQVIDPTIEEALDGSAVFVSLTSNGYLASDYCRQELARYHRRAGGDRLGLVVGGRRRIVNVLLTNLDHGAWPPEFDRALGFVLHDAESDDARGLPSEPGSPGFRRQLRALAEALYELLASMKEASAPPPAPADEERDAAGVVFLADVGATLASQKRRLAEGLRRRGLEIVRGASSTEEETDDDGRVAEALAGADLSVHLLDADAGGGVPRRQVELALEHAGARMIWVPRGLDFDTVADEEHRAFLGELERGLEGAGGYDFVRGLGADLAGLVAERLEDLRGAAKAADGADRCLLVTHDKDTAHVWPVAMALQEQGIQPFVNQEANEPRGLLQLYEERLKKVARLIVFYGAVSRAWVEERIETAAKVAVMEKRLDLELAVFDAPPEKSPEDLDFGGLIRVRMLHDANEALEFAR